MTTKIKNTIVCHPDSLTRFVSHLPQIAKHLKDIQVLSADTITTEDCVRTRGYYYDKEGEVTIIVLEEETNEIEN